MGSANGSKWIIVLSIYFVILTSFMTFISNSVGGSIETQINTLQDDFCGSSRTIYESFNSNPIFDTSLSREEIINSGYTDVYFNIEYYETLLNCDISLGVLSNETCNNLEGCSWTYDTTASSYTCTGEINASYYDIDTYSYLFSSTNYVASHINSQIGQRGSICNSPNVYDNESLCNLFSCTWYDDKILSDLSIEDIKLNLGYTSNLKTAWGTLGELFTLRFDIGFENPMFTYIFNFFVFWLPMLFLIFAFIQIIRG